MTRALKVKTSIFLCSIESAFLLVGEILKTKHWLIGVC